uniref:Uncharacterized protein n=1 Tax=Anguilla anguilla TaxID=7936 RepID=A0A0E9T8E1_ANGAN
MMYSLYARQIPPGAVSLIHSLASHYDCKLSK